MKYSVTWKDKVVHVKYEGDINNEDIESAHFELNGDERFYDCKYLILDVTDCITERISVPELFLVIATDLGAAKTIKSLKVAMVANKPNGIEKVTEYISQFQIHNSPWEFEVFHSIDDANQWVEV